MDFEESKKEWEMPPINWFGGYMIARELLRWTKSGKDGFDVDGYIAKMNRNNFIDRSVALTRILNVLGLTLESVKAIQAGGKGFYTDVSEDALLTKIAECVEELKSGGLYKFNEGEFGNLDFSNIPLSENKGENDED